ncbi:MULTISPECIES: hypothetical protein [unclassified Helicobacter]|nr:MULTISPECIES: hypothetical protein [unclassified Helicobacter]
MADCFVGCASSQSVSFFSNDKIKFSFGNDDDKVAKTLESKKRRI